MPEVPGVPDLRVQQRLEPQDVPQVQALVEAVTAADGIPPLSDQVLLHLTGSGGGRHLLAWAPSGLVGYAHLDLTDQAAGSSAELAVHPDARGQGIGRALIETLIGLSPEGRLRVWAHGDRPEAGKLAASLGFVRTRSLWQLRRPLTEPLTEPLPEPRLPEGVLLRTFEKGRDEQAWTALNNRVFAAHPEQGGWGVAEVLVREAEPWFDPAGFFLAVRGNDLVGFHWTKVHDSPGQEAVGEVYVVGVDPAEQGNGLGRALTLVGLRYLQAQGLGAVMLYVDESNRAALRVYEALGFTRVATDVSFSRTP